MENQDKIIEQILLNQAVILGALDLVLFKIGATSFAGSRATINQQQLNTMKLIKALKYKDNDNDNR